MNPEVTVTPTPQGRRYTIPVECGGIPDGPDHVGQAGDHLPREAVRPYLSGKPLRRPRRSRPDDHTKDD